ncbi:MAG: glycosyltransferase family 2 protein [Thermodesulfobacteriota bacterium]
MSSPLISIVIANWNGMKFLDACLGSIYSRDLSSVEVILVDNGSTDGSVDFVRERFSRTVVLENTENLGFAAGNNMGISLAKGKYVLVLNNDTKLSNGFLEKLALAAETSESNVGMWAPKILSLESPDVIDSVGGLVLYPDGIARGRGRLEKDLGQFDGLTEIFFPSACAALYKKEMLDDIGLFDEEFFAYCEDTDLGLRARLAGWKALSVPDAVLYHYYSGTGGRYTPLKAYLVERNRLWVALKNFPSSYLLLTPFYTLWRYIVQIYGIVAGKGTGGKFTEESSALKLVPIVLKAYFDCMKKVPAMVTKRRTVQKNRAVPAGEVGVWFRKYGLSAAELTLKD